MKTEKTRKDLMLLVAEIVDKYGRQCVIRYSGITDNLHIQVWEGKYDPYKKPLHELDLYLDSRAFNMDYSRVKAILS